MHPHNSLDIYHVYMHYAFTQYVYVQYIHVDAYNLVDTYM